MRKERLSRQQVKDLLKEAEGLRRQGFFEEARRVLERALAGDTRSAAAFLLHGVVLCQMGRPADSIPSFRAALGIEPKSAQANCTLGHALLSTGQHEEALTHFDAAIRSDPDFPDAYYNRGVALRALGRNEDAIASFDQALLRQSGDPQAWNNRGNTLHHLRRYGEALASYDRALEVEPRFADALRNRAATLERLDRYSEAVSCYDLALTIQPDDGHTLYARAHALLCLKRFGEAAAGLRKLLALDPAHPYAAGRLYSALAQCCDWSDHASLGTTISQSVERRNRISTPFAFLSVADSPALQKTCAETFVADEFPPQPAALWAGEPHERQRIRLAYLSADYREHATSFLVAGLIEHHDRSRFETIGISLGPDLPDSRMQQRLRAAFERFVDAPGREGLQLAQLLRELEIDILVDLGGFTEDGGVGALAWRPAPVQVNYLGYPGTMGAEYVDYILADRFVIPEGCDQFYAEKVVRLPDCFQANDSARRIAATTPTRAEMALPEQGVVFCCFNGSHKIAPETFDAWMRLLQGVSGSVLWLVGEQACVVSNLRREAVRREVDPARLVFARRAPYEEYLARYRLADLFLDTVPFHAGTTASDALWAGLPVLTLAGHSFAARMAGSLLHAVGLRELVTYSLQDYESLALQLARDAERLAAIRQRLVANRDLHPLFDTDRFRRNVERAYTEMWRRFQARLPPAGFDL